MTASVPPVSAFYWPAIQALTSVGEPIERSEAISAVVDAAGLTDEQLAVPGPGSSSKAEYRASWALSHLKLMGLADNQTPGHWHALPAAEGVTEHEVAQRWRETRREAKSAADAAPETRQTWLLGAMMGGQDQTPRFVEEGVWENWDPTPTELEYVHSMAPGDRVAIKSSFVQKHGLPFDNHGVPVSVMRIKARGEVERVGDDQVFVTWEELDAPRDWYFYTGRSTMWRLPNHPMAEALEAFIFDDHPQDLDAFLHDPYWAGKYGQEQAAREPAADELAWIPFYETVADAVLKLRDRRGWLAELAARVRAQFGQGVWHDKFADGTERRLEDIDPGTLMALFNFAPTPADKRRLIAQEVAQALGVDMVAPDSFQGIPTTHPQQAWLFRWHRERGDAIDRLWQAFADGVHWADHPDDGQARAAFEESLGSALDKSNWQLATALYRCRPLFFCPMDGMTRAALADLGIKAPTDQHAPDAAARYLDVLDRLRSHLADPDAPVRTIPDFALLSWRGSGEGDLTDDGDEAVAQEANSGTWEPYTLDHLIEEGCFVPREQLERILSALRRTKNLILQGAPGTGKTWLAKRLGWVLAGHRSGSGVRVVQFHPNTSYEDFVRGYRPTADESGVAGLRLVDGPFIQLADDARAAHDDQFTMVIEEINRGNPARALGELLTLIEASKRTEGDAIRLTYQRLDSEPEGYWLPPNLHIVGTMNIADRSLAMVDLALRRRFAFVTLHPEFGAAWKKWVQDRVPTEDAEGFADAVAAGVRALNEAIEKEPTLGPSFVVGHSFFTPDAPVASARDWFVEQVESSVRPLLHEYWFDNRAEADRLADLLRDVVP